MMKPYPAASWRTQLRRRLRGPEELAAFLEARAPRPDGRTAAALRELDDHKVRAAFITAMEAAAKRSAELSGA